MAASSKTTNMTKLSKSFKDRLEQLGCPYTKNVEESWITELIFHPGEQRIRLLQWLFSKLDSSVHDLLDPQYASTDMRMDSRIQRLLFVASSLGLCKSDDAELIRGTAPTNKQVAFIDQLLDIICIVDASEDPHMQALLSPHKVSESTNLDEQFARDCTLFDSIALQVPIRSLYVEKPKILPPDIVRDIERHREELGYTDQDKVLVPDGKKLKEIADQLSQDLHHQNDILSQLMKNTDFQTRDEATENKVNRTLKLVLSELSQLVVGFSYCFENEMRAWCNQPTPRLNELGPAFKRVHNLLLQFTALLTSFASLRGSYSSITSDAQQNISALADKTHTSKGLGFAANVSQAALESFQECVDVLEESISRHHQSLALNSTTNTFNASVVKVQP